jgi:hypothetical protein
MLKQHFAQKLESAKALLSLLFLNLKTKPAALAL